MFGLIEHSEPDTIKAEKNNRDKFRSVEDEEIKVGLKYYLQNNITKVWSKEVIRGLGDLQSFLNNYLQYPKPKILIKK